MSQEEQAVITELNLQ